MPGTWLLLGGVTVLVIVFLLLRGGNRSSRARASNGNPGKPSPASHQRDASVPAYKPDQDQIEEAAYLDTADQSIGGDFYAEVAGILNEVLKEHPGRQDMRLKLLEVYFDSGQAERFAHEMAEYQKHMGKKLDDYWLKILEMQSSLIPGAPGMTEAPGLQEGEETIRRFGDIAEAREPLALLASQYQTLRRNKDFYNQLDLALTRCAERPRKLMLAEALTREIGGAKIYLKREDADIRHPRLKVHLMGQAWIAKSMGRTKILYAAMTGDEAVIAASAASHQQLACEIIISRKYHRLREEHFSRLAELGASVTEAQDSKDAYDLRDFMLERWLEDSSRCYMMLTLAAGPHPYPTISVDLQSVIGRETMRQIKGRTGKLPAATLARGGNNADAIGFVEPFLAHKECRLLLISPADESRSGRAQEEDRGKSDIYHKFISNEQQQSADFILQDIEFPRVTRELSMLRVTRRVEDARVSLHEAETWARQIARIEGLELPLETAHVMAYACGLSKSLSPEDSIVVMVAEHAAKALTPEIADS